MAGSSRDRSIWLAQHVLPCEAALRRWLARRPLGGLEVDDVVQETYAILAELETVEHILNAKAYVFATAQSLILRQLRRAKTVSIEAVAEIEALSIVSDEASPERTMADRQELRRLAEAIADLPPKCRETFVLRKVHALSQREVARKLGVSENTVEKHVGKGLRLLMDALGRQGTTGRAEGRDHGEDEAVERLNANTRDRRRH